MGGVLGSQPPAFGALQQQQQPQQPTEGAKLGSAEGREGERGHDEHHRLRKQDAFACYTR